MTTFELKDGNDSFRVLGTATRAVTQRRGWQKVRYQGRWYQLFGGIRNPLFINIKHPIKTRPEA